MKRRRWIVRAVVLAAFLLAIDTLLWCAATGFLRSRADALAGQIRDSGALVTLDGLEAGGWPWAASLRMTIRLRPQAGPVAGRLDAAVTARLSPASPGLIWVDIATATLSRSGGPAIEADAASWTLAVPWAHPDRGQIRATDLHVASGEQRLTVATLSGEMAPIATGGIHLTVQVSGLDLTGAHACGGPMRRFDLDATLPVGLPPLAATARASAQAWRDAGGTIAPLRLAIACGPLDAVVTGRLALDTALAPAGVLDLSARGLPAFVAALSAAGAVPSHAGQAVAGVLSLLGAANGGAVDIPLVVADGAVTAAGFPLVRLSTFPWAAPIAR